MRTNYIIAKELSISVIPTSALLIINETKIAVNDAQGSHMHIHTKAHQARIAITFTLELHTPSLVPTASRHNDLLATTVNIQGNTVYTHHTYNTI